MLFSSLTFLFIFLPIVLLLYYTVFAKSIAARNGLLLIASLIFYAWGEPRFILIMILSIVVNYGFGIMIERFNDKRKLLLVIDVIFNLSMLYIFKYLNFTVQNINNLFGNVLPQTSIVLPIGISFFTFQAMSYVIDVYRKDVGADSYARPMLAFMSLCFKEVRFLDPQEGRYNYSYVEYIDEYDPDIVIMMFPGEGYFEQV